MAEIKTEVAIEIPWMSKKSVDCIHYVPNRSLQCVDCTHPENDLPIYEEDFLSGEKTKSRIHSLANPRRCAKCALRVPKRETEK